MKSNFFGRDRKMDRRKSKSAQKERTSVQLSLKVSPWKGFLFKKYAEHYGFSLKSAFSDAVNSLIEVSIPRNLIKKWAKEFRQKKNEMD